MYEDNSDTYTDTMDHTEIKNALINSSCKYASIIEYYSSSNPIL